MMKILSKEQQKEIYKNLLAEQHRQAETLISEHGAKLKPSDKKAAVIAVMRAINTANNFNSDSDAVLEDIQNLLQSGKGIKELNAYCHNLYETADRFKEIIDNTEKEGMKLRRQNNPHYPDFLKKNTTVYIKIENSLSAYQTIEEQLKQINDVLPAANRIRYHQESGKLEFDKQSFSVGAFFSRRKTELEKLLKTADINFEDKELQEVFMGSDYGNLIELRKKRSVNKDRANHELIRIMSDKALFHQLTDLVQKQHSQSFENKLKHAVSSLRNSYSRASESINFSQQQGSISKNTVAIDTLVVSINPHLIATQSEYKNWRNCTSADDFNHHTVKHGIGEGSVIVYGINSHLPQKKISRVMLTPYTNDKGDVIYHTNRLYGEYNLSFLNAVNKLGKDISSKEKGIYHINPHILPDRAPAKIMQFDNAEDFCRSQNIEHQKSVDGRITLENLNLSRSDFNTLPKFFKEMSVKNLNLSFNPLTSLENCPECENLDISHCDRLDKNCGKDLPDTLKTLNARFSNFNGLGFSAASRLEELNISNNDAVAPEFIRELPPRLKVLKANFTNLTSLKGLKAPCLEELSVNGCEIRDNAETGLFSTHANVER